MSSRLILPLTTAIVNTSTNTFLPQSARLWYFIGEADGKPTYDFLVTVNIYTTAGNNYYAIKFAGQKNGRKVNLGKIFPIQATTIATPTALGHTQIFITPGVGVSGQLGYLLGAVGQ